MDYNPQWLFFFTKNLVTQYYIINFHKISQKSHKHKLLGKIKISKRIENIGNFVLDSVTVLSIM